MYHSLIFSRGLITRSNAPVIYDHTNCAIFSHGEHKHTCSLLSSPHCAHPMTGVRLWVEEKRMPTCLRNPFAQCSRASRSRKPGGVVGRNLCVCVPRKLARYFIWRLVKLYPRNLSCGGLHPSTSPPTGEEISELLGRASSRSRACASVNSAGSCV